MIFITEGVWGIGVASGFRVGLERGLKMKDLTVAQVIVLRSMLELELKSGMRMSRRETALHAFTRLTGINPGRGKTGRAKALRLLEGYVVDIADSVSEAEEVNA